jgi:hypothetical protein
LLDVAVQALQANNKLPEGKTSLIQIRLPSVLQLKVKRSLSSLGRNPMTVLIAH